MGKFHLSPKPILIAGVVIFAVFMLMDLNSRLADLFRLSAQLDVVQNQYQQLESTQQALETQIAYANSDQAVGDYAREELKMVQKGDSRVVVLPPNDATPTPRPQPTPVIQSHENWQVWWALFFEN